MRIYVVEILSAGEWHPIGVRWWYSRKPAAAKRTDWQKRFKHDRFRVGAYGKHS